MGQKASEGEKENEAANEPPPGKLRRTLLYYHYKEYVYCYYI